MTTNLQEPGIRRPGFVYTNKPTIARPAFKHGENHGVIRSSTHRCMWCSSLLPLNDEVCPKCGATQISSDLLDLKEAPAWKKRISVVGKNRNGYTGT